MRNNGWRKPTPGLGIAEQLAQAGEQLAVPKNTAFLACKRVAAHIGLKAGDVLLLDTLGAFTKPQDWEEGRRPIVWASNAYLIERTGFSLSALKRHARRLVDAGVIAFKDSSNGKRWGHRNQYGHIIEAYGYDLAPLAARAGEFEVLFAQLQTERQLCARAKRQITILRRSIRAKLEIALAEGLSGPWAAFAETFDGLLNRLSTRAVESSWLSSLLQGFAELEDKIRSVSKENLEAVKTPVGKSGITPNQSSSNIKEMNPVGSISEPYIQTTNQLYPVISNIQEERRTSNLLPETRSQTPRMTREENWSNTSKKQCTTMLNLKTVMQACPEFTQMARDLGEHVKDWNDLYRVAGQVRPMLGITEQAWTLTLERLGPQVTAAVMALVFEKFSDGKIISPGGYLRGMVRKAEAGELHLERSFYGRLNGKAA